MDSTRRSLLLAAYAAGIGSLAAPLAARAETYPARPIRFVDPFAVGGWADVISRATANGMAVRLKQSIVVDYRPGAGGTIGTNLVARAAPDGYTIVLSNISPLAIAPSLYGKVPYDPIADFEQVGFIGSMPNVLVVQPSFPANTLAEFIKVAKSKTINMTFGSAGNGTTPHLSGELLKMRAGIEAQHIPFQGAGPALVALMSGTLAFTFDSITTATPQIKAGKLKALGITSPKRDPMLPDVPTMEEQGLPDFVVQTWAGIAAPAKTPPAIVATLSKALNAMLADPAFIATLDKVGFRPQTMTPDECKAFIAAEGKKWGAIVKASGAKMQ